MATTQGSNTGVTHRHDTRTRGMSREDIFTNVQSSGGFVTNLGTSDWIPQSTAYTLTTALNDTKG